MRADARVGMARASMLIDTALLREALSAHLVRVRAECPDAELVARMERACAQLA